MPAGTPKLHIFLPSPKTTPYKPARPGRGKKLRLKDRDKDSHYQLLKAYLEDAQKSIEDEKAVRKASALSVYDGFILDFLSAPGFDLALESLESERRGIKLLNVREEIIDSAPPLTCASVFIPVDSYSYFLKKIEDYHTKVRLSGKPENQVLIESIESIRPAFLQSLWTDDISLLPDETAAWCELWIRVELDEYSENIDSTFKVLNDLEIEKQSDFLQFPQRLVCLIKANRSQLLNLFKSLGVIAELRLAKETARFWSQLEPVEQAEWVSDLSKRTIFSPEGQAAVCILDTGLNNGHLLLSPIISNKDCMTFNPIWGAADDNGHGTNMAGIVTYGDLEQALQSTSNIVIKHFVESVKILPPHGAKPNDPLLYGSITQQSALKAEIQSPRNNRSFCMAVTVSNKTQGRPSSWSAAVDSFTSGYKDDYQRLFIISAGNAYPCDTGFAYPESNLFAEIEDPSQAWNALTVGAYTEKVLTGVGNSKGLALNGGLSPFSTTTINWGKKHKWPLKPDVVFEGGNVVANGSHNSEDAALECLTTHYKTTQNQFDTINATSCATAKAAWLSAQIWVIYPTAWPETIRGLIIHSARWTKEMKRQFLTGQNASDYRELIQICGFGVPDLEKVLHSFNNSLTLISQESFTPFKKEKSAIQTKEMHLYELPWPKTALVALGMQEVTIRITLSYFIEPSPGERGWKNRYRYASFGLRFDLNRPNEKRSTFIGRINKAIQAEEDEKDEIPESGANSWCIGSNNRHLGSVHSDWITLSGVELSTMDNIAIYPVGGWWKTRKKEGRWNRNVRYSLVVSIDTPATSIDLYTPIENLVKTSILV